MAPSVNNIPSDVLSRIALATVLLSSNTPTPADLTTIRSLILTCHRFHSVLSLNDNPELYAQIFGFMFDVDPIRRRLGPAAVVSSRLSRMLKTRLELLKRVKTRPYEANGSFLWKTFLMMLENDGKNRYQLDYVNIENFLEALVARMLQAVQSSTVVALDSSLPLLFALMWMVSSRESLAQEPPDRRTAVLDFLEPFVLGPDLWSQFPHSTLGDLQATRTVVEVEYFGHIVMFIVPPLAVFARLCTVQRYNVVKNMQLIGTPGACVSRRPRSSLSFDVDWHRLTAHGPVSQSIIGSSRLSTYLGCSPGDFEGSFEGSLFIPYPIDSSPDVLMYAQLMQCDLREYHAFSANNAIRFVEEHEEAEGKALARAWLPMGVVFHETETSLKVYDAQKGRWLAYKPLSKYKIPSDDSRTIPTIVDTIIIGDTDPYHGTKYGEYTFHGRVRPQDGRVALVRTPAHSHMVDLGTWVFHGQIYGGTDFVGDWRVISTSRYTPGGQGWVHLEKREGREGRADAER